MTKKKLSGETNSSIEMNFLNLNQKLMNRVNTTKIQYLTTFKPQFNLYNQSTYKYS